MITTSNLKSALLSLGFVEQGAILYGAYNSLSTDSIKVDFQNQKITYPAQLKVNEQQTTNFSSNENFVVLDCVYRLLKKGYRPEHIELEKRWPLGHENKGGRADICIYDETGTDVITIIECKTSGKEYNKAYKKLLENGGQLFSYKQQEGSTRWLSLYSSDFDGSKVTYETDVVPVIDDPQKVEQKRTDPTLTLYEDATTAQKLFAVWQETYGQQLRGDLIFDEEASAYDVSVLPLRKKHLKAFTESDASKIVNQFEEVLRHNNVSDKENAFNRLIALFICKLVDEYEKDDEDIVEFQYRQGTDTYEDLQDRLQYLHKKGMEKFMKEEIFYVSSRYPEELFSNYTNRNRNEAIEDLRGVIRKLKYYSNSDFAFKDVHNEELFMQNSKILIEVVQIFERYRIVYPSKHQFLGDLFEQLLSKGFKQNEGQFFTPMPITRFIWDSLPVIRFASDLANSKYPKIIDYACGSGHFLTEAVTTINQLLGIDTEDGANPDSNTNEWVREHIFGIEKDYRLARVSKVSLFMNGAGEGTIIFGDGLDNFPEQSVTNGSFDILVANPPYSVKAFKQHLNLANNTSRVLDFISESGGEIETVFLERIAQLLKPQGLAAVILPVSLLTNKDSSYNAAREVLVNNFLIRAIVQLGNKTFAATGTSTVVLFLEKFYAPPERASLVRDSVVSILNESNLEGWTDEQILREYLNHLELETDEYRAVVVDQSASFERIKANEYFNAYHNAFTATVFWKKIIKSKAYKNLDVSAQKELELDEFIKYVREIEEEKLRYFALTYEHQTLIVSAPSDNKLQKAFLGYEWSNRKGNEGIQITNPGGMLYNENDREAVCTLAAAVRDAYNGRQHELDDDKKKLTSFTSTSMLFNFSRPVFKNTMNLSAGKKIMVDSVFPMIRLEKIPGIDIAKGSTTIRENTAGNGNIKVIAGGKSYAYLHDEANREAHTITVSASGANAGYVNYWDEPIFASDCTTIRTDDETTTLWLYYYLKHIEGQIIDSLQTGSGQPHVSAPQLKVLPVPDLTKEQQHEVVTTYQQLVPRQRELSSAIENYSIQVQSLLDKLDQAAQDGQLVKLDNQDLFEISIGKRVLRKDLSATGRIAVYSANVLSPFGYTNKSLLDDFSKDSVLWGIDGDWMVNLIKANHEFYPTDHCGVLRVKDESLLLPRYAQHLLFKVGSAEKFSRANRASLEAIKALKFTLAPIELQEEVITKILEVEQQLQTAQDELRSIEAQLAQVVPSFISNEENAN